MLMPCLLVSSCNQQAWYWLCRINTLKPRQNGCHFPDNIFKWIFLNENGWVSINISLKFVPRGPINNVPTLVRVVAWRRPGDKPLSEPVMVSLLTHICVTRPQWVNRSLSSMRKDFNYLTVKKYEINKYMFMSHDKNSGHRRLYYYFSLKTGYSCNIYSIMSF